MGSVDAGKSEAIHSIHRVGFGDVRSQSHAFIEFPLFSMIDHNR
jgi:hypothetical protein